MSIITDPQSVARVIFCRVVRRTKYPHKVKFQVGCPAAEKAHAKEWRVFAHVERDGRTICVAKDIENLKPQYVWGIILHEFGHILALWVGEKWHLRGSVKGVKHIGQPAERMADKTIAKVLGVELLFDKELELEYVSTGTIRRLKA